MYAPHDEQLAALFAAQLYFSPQQPITHETEPSTHPIPPRRPSTAPPSTSTTTSYSIADTPPTTNPFQPAPVLQKYSPSRHYYHYTPTAHVAQHFGHHLRQAPVDDASTLSRPGTEQDMTDGIDERPGLHPLQSTFQQGHNIYASSGLMDTAEGMPNGTMKMDAEPYMSNGYLHGRPSEPQPRQGYYQDSAAQHNTASQITATGEGDVDMDMS